MDHQRPRTTRDASGAAVRIAGATEATGLPDDCGWNATGQGEDSAEGVSETGRAICPKGVA